MFAVVFEIERSHKYVGKSLILKKTKKEKRKKKKEKGHVKSKKSLIVESVRKSIHCLYLRYLTLDRVVTLVDRGGSSSFLTYREYHVSRVFLIIVRFCTRIKKLDTKPGQSTINGYLGYAMENLRNA